MVPWWRYVVSLLAAFVAPACTTKLLSPSDLLDVPRNDIPIWPIMDDVDAHAEQVATISRPRQSLSLLSRSVTMHTVGAGVAAKQGRWKGITGCKPTHAPWFSQIALREQGAERLPQSMQSYQTFLDHFPVTRMFYGDCLLWYKYPATQAVAEPQLWRNFDWYPEVQECSMTGCGNLDGGIGRIMMNRRDPKTVLIKPSMWGMLNAYASGWFNKSHNDRVVVIAMDDSNLTTVAKWFQSTPERLVNQTLRYFRTIWVEAKDINIPGVKTMPIGLQENYLREAGVVQAAGAAMRDACVNATCKPRGVIAAWGANSPTETLCTSADRKHSCESRREAQAWSSTATALAAGVEQKLTTHLEWWKELSTFRFLLSPLGAGIQSPKTTESLLVLTIPITHRRANGHIFPAHDDLVSIGFPLVVVDSYEEITLTQLDAWWADLSPRLVSFRRNCLATDAYFKLFTGQISVCN